MNRQQGLLSDSALENLEQDQFGYSSFAENIADTISIRTPADEFVVGIYGQWGAGKSTVLNFVEQNLEERSDSPVVIRFNPWWFSGQPDLINKFFSQFRAGLDLEDNRFDNIREKIATLSRGVSKLPAEAVGVPISPVAKGVADVTETDEPELGEVKESISEALRESDQQIVVFIDDIDRLTNDEIRQMFRLVKSVADFPNVTYVLAFDRDVVVEALEEGERGVQNGDRYLEKIVQLSQHMPIPADNSLHVFFTNRLDAIVGEDEVTFNKTHWQTVYRHGIDPLIETPRSAIRLTNAVKTSYGAIGDEVNYVDLIAIETLRIHFNDIYEKIRENKTRFTVRNHPNQGKDLDHDFLWENYEKPVDTAEMLLSYLFPRYSRNEISPWKSISENEDTYRKRKRICHPDMFNYYFRQTVPEGEIPQEEFTSLKTSAQDHEKFAQILLDLSEQEGKSGRSRAYNFLKRFQEHSREIETRKEATLGLFEVADHLVQVDPRANSLDDGNIGLLFQTVYSLIEEADKPTQILDDAISTSHSPYFGAYLLGLLSQEHGEYGGTERLERERLLQYEDICDLRETWVNQIENQASRGDLADVDRINLVLERWRDWGDSDDAVEWVRRYTADNESLIEFIEYFLTDVNASTGETYEILKLEQIEPFLDIEDVESRFNTIDDSGLTERQEEVVEIFIQAQSLEDPNSLEGWAFNRDR